MKRGKECPRPLTLTLLAFILTLAFSTAPRADAQFQREDRSGVPEWKIDPDFKHDTFTFARVRYTSFGGRSRRGWGRRGGQWATDYPDAELNLGFRLQQMTSLKVNPEPVVVSLSSEEIFAQPFLYIVEPGSLTFQEDEITNLRKHLENGGFLMIDDFWGVEEWLNIEHEMKRVFPTREFVELPLEHPIFHSVFDLKEIPQVPGIYAFMSGYAYERQDAKGAHYYGIFDDKGRMMVIICRDTDLGDGWEREGESVEYFREYAEKRAYPMAINIIFYAMTH